MMRSIISIRLLIFVLAVDIAALAALTTLPAVGLKENATAAAFIVVIAFAAGVHPVRIPGLRLEMTATHPLILIALAFVGPMTAALAGIAGVMAAAARRRSQRAPIRLAFNLGAVMLSVSATSWAFLAAGGRPGADIVDLLWPLTAATTVLFFTNTCLVSAVIALEKGQSLARTWHETFHWTAASYFAGLTLAVLILLAIGLFGPWSIVLSIPPCWLLISFYREHKKRILESQRRYDEVMALNQDLDKTVRELRAAMEHVKQLQGLIPICMHCKSIRDDENSWHRLEEYLSEHSDIKFTHSLCETCKVEHYTAVEALP